ncbi:hypothetical protein [Aquimarina sp. RZ0]|uniref:hypothetical protein n=1 Tax=Aquimarina sp. RZ0 TaxID=2607730 RepID=UPI0011F3FD24|nr:hypothetical protein [Aquimarina sp. RZ0]KAA1247748.1 hypothetical protein F0000_02770 [Aquimarina sp. RZ0]
MNKDLQEWFQLEILHEYFEMHLCPVFKVKPFASTQQLMKNYTIHIQQLGNVYKGYVGVSDTKATWQELKGVEDLYFQLIHTDSNFANYTDVSTTKKEDTLLYITNSIVANRVQEQESIVPDTYLPAQPLRFNVSVPSDKLVTVRIKNSKGERIQTQVSKEKKSRVFVDIEVFGTGIYEIWIDDKLIKTFFGTSERMDENCYGILHTQMRSVIESLKENRVPSLKINFPARATYWQYAVVVPDDKKITIRELLLEGSDKVQYTGPEEKEIAGGVASKIFTSLKMIKFQQKVKEHPLLKIKYNNDFSDTVLELDLKMPVPNASKVVSKKQNNENLFYSQTIIYV